MKLFYRSCNAIQHHSCGVCQRYEIDVRAAAVDEARGTPRARSPQRRGARRYKRVHTSVHPVPRTAGGQRNSHCSSLSAGSTARRPLWLETMAGGGAARLWMAAGSARAPRFIQLEGLARLHAPQYVMRMPCRESRRRRTETVESERRRCGWKMGANTGLALTNTPSCEVDGERSRRAVRGSGQRRQRLRQRRRGQQRHHERRPHPHQPADQRRSERVGIGGDHGGGGRWGLPQLAASTTLAVTLALAGGATNGHHRRRCRLPPPTLPASRRQQLCSRGEGVGMSGGALSVRRPWGDRSGRTKTYVVE